MILECVLIEPGPPAWKAEILTTRPRRIHTNEWYILDLFCLSGTFIEIPSSSLIVEAIDIVELRFFFEFNDVRDDDICGRDIRLTASRILCTEVLRFLRDDDSWAVGVAKFCLESPVNIFTN
jgi:hypothetical protein